MAKALLAAVSLALVLVAAVVVPLVVMPSLTGFNDWPRNAPRAPHAQVVSVSLPSAPAPVAVPQAPRVVIPHHQLAQVPPRRVETQTRTPTQTEAPKPTQPPAPQAAPEAPLPAPVVDARDQHVPAPVALSGQLQAAAGLDGTNRP
jgi:hypothetical protein